MGTGNPSSSTAFNTSNLTTIRVFNSIPSGIKRSTRKVVFPPAATFIGACSASDLSAPFTENKATKSGLGGDADTVAMTANVDSGAFPMFLITASAKAVPPTAARVDPTASSSSTIFTAAVTVVHSMTLFDRSTSCVWDSKSKDHRMVVRAPASSEDGTCTCT